MKQIKTFSDNRLNGYCAFCGEAPNTLDHVPSKVLLDSPFPENLPVVPACSACNNSFSLDEEYVACLIECVLHGTTEPQALSRKKICKILSRKPGLKQRLEQARIAIDDNIYFQAEEERVKNVVLKLAQGHVRFENSESAWARPYSIRFSPLATMSEIERTKFFKTEKLALWPEIGSRSFQRTALDQTQVPCARWQVVQPNNYGYAVFRSASELIGRIIIWEYLACEVIWS